MEQSINGVVRAVRTQPNYTAYDISPKGVFYSRSHPPDRIETNEKTFAISRKRLVWGGSTHRWN